MLLYFFFFSLSNFYAQHTIDFVHRSLYTSSLHDSTHNAFTCLYSRLCDPLYISLLCYGPESIMLILAGIDRAVSHCKRCLLHHAYMCLNPFHLSLSVLCSNSRRCSYLYSLTPLLMESMRVTKHVKKMSCSFFTPESKERLKAS